MNQIKCPKCGEIFTIDEGAYAAIVAQIRDEIFTKEINKREKELKDKYELQINSIEKDKERLISEKMEEQQKRIDSLLNQISSIKKDTEHLINEAVNDKEKQIIALESKLNEADQNKKLAVSEAVDKEKEKINELLLQLEKAKNEISQMDNVQKLAVADLNASHALALKEKDDQIAYYKDLKAKTSVKLLGESLEQHCLVSFNQIRSAAFPKAYFEKDNDVVEGTKGDFIFKDFDDIGNPYISILFEMKNEADETSTKHTNESFFKKLDEDRKKKGCEYAVLVTTLEKDNEYYNYGIVDVSHKYEKMYVIRPQFFIPLITILRNAAMKNINALVELEYEKQRNFDIHKFKENLNLAQSTFDKHYNAAKNKFEEAVKRINDTITYLEKIRDALTGCGENLRLANNNVQQLSLNKLVKGTKTLEKQLNAIEAEDIKSQD